MRRRIMLLVVGMTALVLLAVAVPIGILVGKEVVQRGQEDTVQQASSVGLYLRSAQRTTTEIRNHVNSLSSTSGRPTSVLCPDGTLVGSLPDAAADVSNTPPIDGPGRGNPSPGGGGSGGGGGGADDSGGTPQLIDVPGGGLLAALHAGFGDNGYLVRVYSSSADLRSGETAWLLLLAGGSVAMLLLAAGAAELLTRRIVRPLVDTAETARALSVGDTAARAPTSGPREIGDVGVALNRLADRIDQLIAEERETVADLSHRLRTPLTALRLDAEALRDPVDAERVGSHVSTLERMLTAVIHAARRPQREGRMPSCDATAVVGTRVAFWSALAEDQERTSRVSLPDRPVVVRASPEDLAAAVDALLENVVAHTPEGTAFEVRLTATGDGGRLEVADDGPGLPLDEPVRGRSDRGSSGLGLDIARRCAEASGGSMTLGASPSGGALITLDLLGP
jgi:signal transduction histidine kinase